MIACRCVNKLTSLSLATTNHLYTLALLYRYNGVTNKRKLGQCFYHKLYLLLMPIIGAAIYIIYDRFHRPRVFTGDLPKLSSTDYSAIFIAFIYLNAAIKREEIDIL